MNKQLLTGIAIGAGVIGAGAAVAHFSNSSSPKFADVIDVQPVTQTVSTPRQVCRDEVVTEQKPVQDEHRIAGTVIGAVVGGVLGHQIGSGDGTKIATAAGAAAGGYAGNRVQNRIQERNTTTSTQSKCETVADEHTRRIGYDVTYRLGDKQDVVRMANRPGAQIPVQNGQLVIDKASVAYNR